MLSMMRFTAVAPMLLGIVGGLINPIIPGFNPDPSIVRVGEDFFLATSTFEFFPGVPIYHSKDLVKWENIGHVLTRVSQLPLRGTATSGGVFAPTLRYNKGRFYVTTTIFDVINPPDNATRTPRSFYVSTDNIWNQNSWSDPIYFDQLGFDPDLFFDDDGKVYLTTTFRDSRSNHYGQFANWITEVDLATGNSLTDTRLLHVTSIPETRGYPLTEGSHLYKINGYYHMITADSGTEENHSANSYRSRSLTGPWEENPNNPLLWNGRDLRNPILSTGHADMVEGADGKWWAVFLATRPQRNTESGPGKAQLGRETFLAPVKWDPEGWPIFNNNKTIVEHDPDVLYDLERPRVWRDDFNTSGPLATDYYYLRTPYKDFKDFTSAPGKLRLRGNVYTLSQRETPAVLLRKQVDINTTFSTELSAFSPASARQEAGATVYLNIHYHSEIGVTRHSTTGKRVIVARTRSGPDATLKSVFIEDEAAAAGKPVTLFIEARPLEYRLGYKTETSGPDVVWVASVGSRWLQAFVQGWQNFVGTHFGIYTSGDGLPILNPADFDYIQTERN